MRSSRAASALMAGAFGLTLLAACSTTESGISARATAPAGVASSLFTAPSRPSSKVSTKVSPARITEPPHPAATQKPPNPTTDQVPTTYAPPPRSQASIGGWVAHFSNGAKFLGWTVTGDTVAGTYSETLLLPGATTLTANSASFNGTINGASVTLTFSHGFGSTVSGELAGETLSLSIPQTDGTLQVEVYHPGTTADFNADGCLSWRSSRWRWSGSLRRGGSGGWMAPQGHSYLDRATALGGYGIGAPLKVTQMRFSRQASAVAAGSQGGAAAEYDVDRGARGHGLPAAAGRRRLAGCRGGAGGGQ